MLFVDNFPTISLHSKKTASIDLKKYSEHKAHYTINCDTIYAFRAGVTC